MYEEFFQFSKRPFTALPNNELYFPGKLVEESRRSLHRILQRGNGIALVLGPHGTGKTLLLEKICNDLRHGECGEELRKIPVISMNGPHLSGVLEFLRLLAHGLELPYSEKAVGELRLAVFETLRRDPNDGPAIGSIGGLVLIDDAQHIDIEVLEEIRTITDTCRLDTAGLRFVLAGTLSFEERLTLPRLEAFNQRVACHACLEPFGRRETEDYIGWQIAAVTTTGNPGLFSSESCNAVYRLTDGYPRLINQLCEAVLEKACETEVGKIPPEMVEKIWNSLQRFADTPAESEDGGSFPVTSIEKAGCVDSDQEETVRAHIIDDAVGCEGVSDLGFGDCGDEDLATFDLDCSSEVREKSISNSKEANCDKVSDVGKGIESVKPGDYVYDTNSPVVLQYPCYIDKNIAMLNWVAPGHRIASGTGRAYREVAPEFRSPPIFSQDEEAVTPHTKIENVGDGDAKTQQKRENARNEEIANIKSSTQNSNCGAKDKNTTNTCNEIYTCNTRIKKNAKATMSTPNRAGIVIDHGETMQSAIKEEFSDVEPVSREAVPLHQIIAKEHHCVYTQNRKNAEIACQEDVFAQTAERMTQLADRLEQSADRFEQVEGSITSSVQEVEVHVRTIKEAQPSYRELFDAISTLHETLTNELNRYTLPLDTQGETAEPLHVFTGERRRWDEGASTKTALMPRLCRRASLQRTESAPENEVTTMPSPNSIASTTLPVEAESQAENVTIEQTMTDTQDAETPELTSKKEVLLIKPARIENFSVQNSISQSDAQNSSQSPQGPRKANIEFRPRKR